MGKVLIIDDDRMMAKALSGIINSIGHEATYATTLEEGFRVSGRKPFDLVFLDVRMPDGNGLDAIIRLLEMPSRPEIIVITAQGEAEDAQLAIQAGAWDYIEKSPSIKELISPLNRALEYRKDKLSRRNTQDLKRDKIIGKSSKIQRCIDLLGQAAACEVNVLITGETGTGKELFARAIHDNSRRSDKSFVVVDCTVLPDNLVESVLFGHRKGAFTGADKDQEGLVAQANGGTLFLDEIGELPMELQKKLLRVLESGSFRPVGCKKECSSDFRLIAATNKNLEQMASVGAFRDDLFFRLRSMHIELPPLRERSEDIVELALMHVQRLCELYRIPQKEFSTDFMEAMEAHEWPGNIRELVNTLDAAVALAGEAPTLYQSHLPVSLRMRIARKSFENRNGSGQANRIEECDSFRDELTFRDFKDVSEKSYLTRLLTRTNHDLREASRISGISRTHLYELINKHQFALSK